MNKIERLTTAEVARAEEAGVSIANIVVPRDTAGELLDGAFNRSGGGWTYTGKMLSDGQVRSFTDLVMSPFAGRMLDDVMAWYASARLGRAD